MKKDAGLKNKGCKLPKSFRGYFWDCDFASLNMDEYHDFILGRLLQYGGRDALVWIFHNFGQKDIIAYLKKREGTALDRKSRLFWTKVSTFDSVWG